MINLFINIYEHPDPVRQKELDACMKMNRLNSLIDNIYTFTGRLTYNEFFAKITEKSDQYSVNIIANSDIYFDETIALADRIKAHQCYALSRWDVTSVNPFDVKLYEEAGSQDAWIFRGHPRPIRKGDFPLGRPGCDNRIAHELQQAGYVVLNPCRSIKAIHYHLSEIRTYNKEVRTPDTVVPPPYAFIKPIYAPSI